ncbi:MAG: hypothetical protein KF709_05630 [Gemmatimonadaceae bacterium]|nr:hypothetical protein [Gemmatimonadaceae bacterium]
MFRLGVAAVLLLSSFVLRPSSLQSQQTRAERSAYTETSSYADVITFLDSLQKVAPVSFVRGELGRTTQGKVLPYVIAARPLVRTPAEARASGKPVVYVQGNIHGGEVEGKESLQAILRDLLTDRRANVLDSIVLIAVPIYNGDGNDALGPQQRMRGSQNGPEQVGNRANGQQLDLNRDYIKAEAPETMASLRMFVLWDPHVFVDLHTTNGSYHGYALTYSPSLHPAAMDPVLAPAGAWTRDTLLPAVRARARAKGVETFDYGNFIGEFAGRDDPTSLRKGGWETYEHKPRFGTNYYGLRNRVSVLSEAYSHDPFQRRVEATTVFVRELLSLVAEQRATVLARTAGAATAAARAASSSPSTSPSVAIRAEMTKSPFRAPILVEALEATGDSVRYEAGLRPGLKRTHRFTAVEMPVYDRFDATRARALPSGWVIANPDSALLARLAYHGLELSEIAGGSLRLRGERFVVDSIVRAPRPFQGHQEVLLEGRWEPTEIALEAGSYYIRADQPLALLAAILLEPESDDGLTTWNFFDPALSVGSPHPVRRILAPLPPRPAR